MNKLFLFAGSLSISSWVMAQNPLSVHVLNLENGLPSSDVTVTLEEQKNGKWVQISEAKTNEQGRIDFACAAVRCRTSVWRHG